MPSKYGFGDNRSKNAPVYKKSSGFKMKGSPMQRNFGIGSPAHQNKGTSPSIGASSKGESNVGLNTYNAAEIGKTLQTNEHMSKRKPAPTKQGSYGDPSEVIVNPDILSGTVDHQGNTPSTTSQGGGTSGGNIMGKIGGMIPGFIFGQIDKWKARDMAKHKEMRNKEAEKKAELHAKVSKPKETRTWQTKNSSWTPPW